MSNLNIIWLILIPRTVTGSEEDLAHILEAGTTGRGVEINALQSFKESRYQSRFG